MAVQYSIQQIVSDGTLSNIVLGIQYLQRNDIYVRIAGEETPQSGGTNGYTWSFVDNTTIRVLPVVPNGIEVIVYRRTDIDSMYNVYSQNAQFDEATIDENNQQLLYIAQEYLEQDLTGTGIDELVYVRSEPGYEIYRFTRTDGSYLPEFPVPTDTAALARHIAEPNQHPISGVVGLREELDKLTLTSVLGMVGFTPSGRVSANVVSMYDSWAVDALGDYQPSGGGYFVFEPNVPKARHDGAFFISPTVPWDGSLGGRDAWLDGVGETAPSGNGVWVRCIEDRTINILWYGATRTYSDDNTKPISKFIDKMLRTNMNGYVPKGNYRSANRILFNINISPTRNFGELYGDGAYESVLHCSSTEPNPIHFYNLHGPTGPDCFQGAIRRLGFSASPLSGAAILFGLEDFSDNFGNWSFEQVHFASDTGVGLDTNNRIVLKLNWLFDCTFNNVVVTGRPNFGKAVMMNKVQFSTWNGGSISNAKYGLIFGDVSANNHNVVFTALDLENIHYGITSQDTHLEKVKFISVFVDIRDPIADGEPVDNYAVSIEQGDIKAVLLEDVRVGRTYSNLYGGKFFGSGHNHTKCTVTGYYPNQTNPNVPASDIAYTNTTGQVQRVLVYPAVGTITLFINGEETGLRSGEFTLDTGEFLAVRYTGAPPAWRWKAIR